jgi:tetratricopeptide (TPR) repeat protein
VIAREPQPPLLGRRSAACFRRCVATLGIASCLLANVPRTARAADVPSSEDQRRESAKAKYKQGVDAYSNEHYADAVRLFLEADALSPSAALSYNIARAYEKLADDAQTLRWYRNYLRLSPSATNAADVQKYVAVLSDALAKKGIQQVTVLSAPVGATVSIDGTPLGVTPLTVELRPGEHALSLSARSYADASQRFTLAASTPIDLQIQLEPAPASNELAAGYDHRRRFGIAPYVTLGIGGALLGASAIFELERRSAQNSAKSDTTQLDYEHDYDATHSRQVTARVLLGAGGIVAMTGAALLVFNARLSPESRASVAGLPGGGALYLEHSF